MREISPEVRALFDSISVDPKASEAFAELRRAALAWGQGNLGAVVENVTRFEVIDSSGRAYVSHDIAITAELRDDGRTLKVFVKDGSDDE